MAMPQKKEEKKQGPILKIREGNLSVNVWENTKKDKASGEDKVNYTFSWEKSYLDAETEEWKTTTSLFPNEALVLAGMLTAAYMKLSVHKDGQ